MGCCYSWFCKTDDVSQAGDCNERTHLLQDPVSNNLNIQSTHSENMLSPNIDCSLRKNDEQSALSRILQETATNVIDVAALDSHNMQHHEYAEKMRQYNQKVHQVVMANKQTVVRLNRHFIVQDESDIWPHMTAKPVCQQTADLVSSALSKAIQAISDIRVDHKEDLVVPFNIPG